ncbi:MAG TPA: hypothetical protein VH597_13580 [Verrucomicrobiae bacterium]|jgi:hypothetical protein|nr:hypothetical protein [Verrucomicrobiae bacterium]
MSRGNIVRRMGNISITDPIGLAIERVRVLLFRPFDLGKWFTIGFCAWLAGLGERRFGGNFNGSSNSSSQPGDFHQQFEHARGFVIQNLYWILPLTIFVVAVCLALGVLFLWLNSRGKFMFLYCVALNRAEVREPWNRFSDAANSLFWFRLVLSLIGMAITLPLLLLAGIAAFSMFIHSSWNPAGILAIIAIVMGMMVIGIFFALVRKLTMEFVVPIMFLRGSRSLDAWREFLQLLRPNAGQFVLYILFQIVIALATGAIVVAVVLVTCCLAGCVMMIPYIGTVLLLPVLVFKRAYSLYYFAQYGPGCNVFPPATP